MIIREHLQLQKNSCKYMKKSLLILAMKSWIPSYSYAKLALCSANLQSYFLCKVCPQKKIVYE